MQIQNAIGLKTISWDSEKKQFISPARPDFTWSHEGLQIAKCTVFPKHDAPVDICSCGLYATFLWNIAKNYDRRYLNVMLLVEAGGRTVLHEYGFRSQQMRFIGAIKQGESLFDLAAYQAADFYELPIFDRTTALIIMDIQNVHLMDWYQPVHLSRQQAVKLWRMENEITTKAN